MLSSCIREKGCLGQIRFDTIDNDHSCRSSCGWLVPIFHMYRDCPLLEGRLLLLLMFGEELCVMNMTMVVGLKLSREEVIKIFRFVAQAIL